jgi:hypothetical protein
MMDTRQIDDIMQKYQLYYNESMEVGGYAALDEIGKNHMCPMTKTRENDLPLVRTDRDQWCQVTQRAMCGGGTSCDGTGIGPGFGRGKLTG